MLSHHNNFLLDEISCADRMFLFQIGQSCSVGLRRIAAANFAAICHPIRAHDNLRSIKERLTPASIPRDRMSSMPGKILFSGASGMIGSVLVRAAEANRIQTVQLVRHNTRNSSEILWTPDDPVPISNPASLEGLDAV